MCYFTTVSLLKLSCRVLSFLFCQFMFCFFLFEVHLHSSVESALDTLTKYEEWKVPYIRRFLCNVSVSCKHLVCSIGNLHFCPMWHSRRIPDFKYQVISIFFAISYRKGVKKKWQKYEIKPTPCAKCLARRCWISNRFESNKAYKFSINT